VRKCRLTSLLAKIVGMDSFIFSCIILLKNVKNFQQKVMNMRMNRNRIIKAHSHSRNDMILRGNKALPLRLLMLIVDRVLQAMICNGRYHSIRISYLMHTMNCKIWDHLLRLGIKSNLSLMK
jgi:hypothetical protein